MLLTSQDLYVRIEAELAALRIATGTEGSLRFLRRVPGGSLVWRDVAADLPSAPQFVPWRRAWLDAAVADEQLVSALGAGPDDPPPCDPFAKHAAYPILTSHHSRPELFGLIVTDDLRAPVAGQMARLRHTAEMYEHGQRILSGARRAGTSALSRFAGAVANPLQVALSTIELLDISVREAPPAAVDTVFGAWVRDDPAEPSGADGSDGSRSWDPIVLRVCGRMADAVGGIVSAVEALEDGRPWISLGSDRRGTFDLRTLSLIETRYRHREAQKLQVELLEPSGPPILVQGDAEAVRRLVMSVLSGSAKALERCPSVSCAPARRFWRVSCVTDPAGRTACLSVADSGLPYALDPLAALFPQPSLERPTARSSSPDVNGAPEITGGITEVLDVPGGSIFSLYLPCRT